MGPLRLYPIGQGIGIGQVQVGQGIGYTRLDTVHRFSRVCTKMSFENWSTIGQFSPKICEISLSRRFSFCANSNWFRLSLVRIVCESEAIDYRTFSRLRQARLGKLGYREVMQAKQGHVRLDCTRVYRLGQLGKAGQHGKARLQSRLGWEDQGCQAYMSRGGGRGSAWLVYGWVVRKARAGRLGHCEWAKLQI